MNTTRLWRGVGLTLILLGAVMATAQPVEPPAVLSAPEVLTLGGAVAEALASNPALHAGRAGLEASRWQSRQSWMAYLPSGSWSSSVTRVDEDSYLRANAAKDGMEALFEGLAEVPGFPDMGDVTMDPFLYRNTWRHGLTINQQFPLNVNLIGQSRLSGAGLRASEAGLDAQRSDMVFLTRLAYFQVLAARQLHRVAWESLGSAENRLALARDKAELGMLPRSDVLRWETTVAEARSGELAARNGALLAEMDLNRLLGRKLDRPTVLAPIDESCLSRALALADEDSGELAERIISESPAAMALGAGCDAASAGKTLALSGITPSLHFSATYGWQDNDTFELDGDRSWSATAALALPVFDLGTNYAAWRQAAADQRRSEFETDDALAGLRMAAYASWHEVARARENLVFRESAERQAKETYDEMTGRYEVGHIAEFDLVDVQTAWTAARAQAVAARYEYFGALASLESLVGGDMEIGEEGK